MGHVTGVESLAGSARRGQGEGGIADRRFRQAARQRARCGRARGAGIRRCDFARASFPCASRVDLDCRFALIRSTQSVKEWALSVDEGPRRRAMPTPRRTSPAADPERRTDCPGLRPVSCQEAHRKLRLNRPRGWEEFRMKFDVIVIGSGFGGAITGCRLAEAGAKVLILERGRHGRMKRPMPTSFPGSSTTRTDGSGATRIPNGVTAGSTSACFPAWPSRRVRGSAAGR